MLECIYFKDNPFLLHIKLYSQMWFSFSVMAQVLIMYLSVMESVISSPGVWLKAAGSPNQLLNILSPLH